MKRLIAALLLLPALANASGSATLSWTRPSRYADNTVIPTGTVITYNVYVDGVKVNATYIDALTYVYNDTGATCFTKTFSVTAWTTVESDKTIPVVATNCATMAPGKLTITIK